MSSQRDLLTFVSEQVNLVQKWVGLLEAFAPAGADLDVTPTAAESGLTAEVAKNVPAPAASTVSTEALQVIDPPWKRKRTKITIIAKAKFPSATKIAETQQGTELTDQQGLDLDVSDSSAESKARKKASPTEPDSKSAAKPVTGKAEKSSSEAAAVPQVSGFAKASFDKVAVFFPIPEDQQVIDLDVLDSEEESLAGKKANPTKPDSKPAAKSVTGKGETSSSDQSSDKAVPFSKKVANRRIFEDSDSSDKIRSTPQKKKRVKANTARKQQRRNAVAKKFFNMEAIEYNGKETADEKDNSDDSEDSD